MSKKKMRAVKDELDTLEVLSELRKTDYAGYVKRIMKLHRKDRLELVLFMVLHLLYATPGDMAPKKK